MTGRNPTVNDTPRADQRFGFRPFWIDKVGKYIAEFSVQLGSQEILKKEIELNITGYNNKYRYTCGS